MTDEELDASLAKLVAESDAGWRAQQEAPPPEVFHYTSGRALRGVVESTRFRATLSAELNDLTELKHSADRLRAALMRRRDAARLPEFRILYPPQVTQFEYERADMSSVFVASSAAQKTTFRNGRCTPISLKASH